MAAGKSFLILQTAFIGDVILATALIEKIHRHFPGTQIDFLLRKGNEELLIDHPYLRSVLIWNKKKDKFKNLLLLVLQIRKNKYDYLINVHRFSSSGLITLFSGAEVTIGFDKNPFSLFFTKSVKHEIKEGVHEVDRNQKLIEEITDNKAAKPKLYPSVQDVEAINKLTIATRYICIAPTSVWFTKQFPYEKWIELLTELSDKSITIFLLGARADNAFCEAIKTNTTNRRVINLSGELSLLQSAALMQKAVMNYVNDSAPMHLASAMNAPTTAIYCSTGTEFGFGPLSENSLVVETKEKLYCRPCGLHGHRTCPEGHFKCAMGIDVRILSERV